MAMAIRGRLCSKINHLSWAVGGIPVIIVVKRAAFPTEKNPFSGANPHP